MATIVYAAAASARSDTIRNFSFNSVGNTTIIFTNGFGELETIDYFCIYDTRIAFRLSASSCYPPGIELYWSEDGVAPLWGWDQPDNYWRPAEAAIWGDCTADPPSPLLANVDYSATTLMDMTLGWAPGTDPYTVFPLGYVVNELYMTYPAHPYVLMVLNHYGIRSDNVWVIPVGVPRPDLVALSLRWNVDEGGADFQYSVGNAPLETTTSASVFWSSSTNVSGIIGAQTPIFKTNILAGTAGVTEVIHLPAAAFGNPPTNANRVLLVLDYGNLVQESNETNNVIALESDIAAKSMVWTPEQGGVTFSYVVSTLPLKVETTAKLFWASGVQATNIIPGTTAIYSQAIPSGATGPSGGIVVPAALLESRPAGATHILLVVDQENLVEERDEANNVLALALKLPVVVLVRGLQFAGGTLPAEYWREAIEFLGTSCEIWVCDSLTGMEEVETGARQLHNYIESRLWYRAQEGLPPVPELSLVAHSYGGLISRAYLHRRPLEWSGDPKVKQVVMLSTPNCGSYAAVLGLSVGWMPVAGSQPALFCLTPPFVQWVFNTRYPDGIPPAPFYLFGGDRGFTSPLYMILRNLPPGTINPNDGWVTVGSAHGYMWGFPLPPRQVGGARVTVADDHSTITSDPGTLSAVRSILLGNVGSGTQSTAGQGEWGPPPPPGTPGTTMVTLTNGLIEAGAVVRLPVRVDECTEVTFSLSDYPGQGELTLTMPDGQTIDSGSTNAGVRYSAATNGRGGTMSFVVENPVPGQWSANFRASGSGTNGVAWSLLVTEQSEVAIVPITEYFQVAGNAVIGARLAAGTQAVNGAVVSAVIQSPEGDVGEIALYDDGLHGDGVVGDGVYASGDTGWSKAGTHRVAYSAIGTNVQGQTFTRSAGGTFQIAPATVRLAGKYDDEGVYSSSGWPPVLRQVAVYVGVEVASNGVYCVSGVLTDTAGNELAAGGAAPRSLGEGLNYVTMYFEGDALRRATNDGPYLLRNVVVWDDTLGPSLRADHATNAYWTKKYYRNDFSDQIPPQTVSDLSGGSVGSERVVLRWTAPDNEGGPAAGYVLRYRKGGLWPGVWDDAVTIAGVPAPAASGELQTLTVEGLDVGSTYYFGLKSVDLAGNESDLSNVAIVRLPSAFTSARLLVGGEFQFSFAGEAGRSYVVEVSTNLVDWLPLCTNVIGATERSFVFTDSQTADFRQRFYRCGQGQ